MKKAAWLPLSWFFIFIFIPLLLVFVTSFLSRGLYGGMDWVWQLGNYRRLWDMTYLIIFLDSLKLSLLTTVMCLVLGLPAAWAICTSSARLRVWLILAVSIPFFMNLIVRIYSLRILTSYDGTLIKILESLGLSVDHYAFSQNQYLVFYGMVCSYLPFMIFPLYANFEKFDFALVEAARDLGASSWTVLTEVLFPNLRPAIASGCLMVFVPALGEFVIPDLLGGAKSMLVGNLITEQFLKSRDWPFGAAISIVLILILAVSSYVILKWGRKVYE